MKESQQIDKLDPPVASAVISTQSYPASTYDVQSMYYYSTQTYRTLSDDDSRHFVWQVDVPELSFQHEFLLYGLLAFTAFHRCRMSLPEERDSLVRVGRHYKQYGLSKYIPELERSSSENYHALFAFSLLLGSLCLAELQLDFEQTELSTKAFFSSLVDISNLLSGCIAIADQHRDILRRGDLAPLLGSDLEAACGSLEDFPSGLREALEKDFYAVQHDPDHLPSADTEACIAAAKRLGLVYPANSQAQAAGQPPGSRAAFIAWPVLGGRAFLELMHSRDTLALICLAHYGAILHQYRGLWFLEGLGAKLVSSVLQVVPDSSRPYLEWAATAVS